MGTLHRGLHSIIHILDFQRCKTVVQIDSSTQSTRVGDLDELGYCTSLKMFSDTDNADTKYAWVRILV